MKEQKKEYHSVNKSLHMTFNSLSTETQAVKMTTETH